MGEVTQIIIDNIANILETNQIKQDILGIDTKKVTLKEIDDYISVLYKKWPRWGDVIFPVVKGDAVSPANGEAYTDAECKEYYKHIKKAFKENHVLSRDGNRPAGSLDPTRTTRLDSSWKDATISEYFNKPSYNISREDGILYCFGLNYPVEDASEQLKKVLLQPDFDVTDYKEAIYKYCLKEKGRHKYPYEELAVLLREYERIEVPQKDRKPGEYTEYYSQQLDAVSDRKGMIEYLSYLKSRNYHSEYRKLEFFNIISSLPFVIDEETEQKIDRDPEQYTDEVILEIVKPSSARLISTTLEKKRAEAAKRMKDVHLLDHEILFKLFSEKIGGKDVLIRLSEDDINERLNNNQKMTRKYFLITMFLDYLYDAEYFKDDVFSEDTDYYNQTLSDFLVSEEKLEDGEGFVQNMNNSLMDANMHILYLRNPFEAFLYRCILDPHPWNYFMASWYYALNG